MQSLKSEAVCKPCAACGSDIPRTASVCPLCQKSQNRWVRSLNASSGPVSLLVAVIALTVTLVGNYISSIDKYFGYYFFHNPPLLGTANWKPDITTFPHDERGRYDVDLKALNVEATVYNDGFSPTFVLGYECSATVKYNASIYSALEEPLSIQSTVPFTAKATLSFTPDGATIVAVGTSETIQFRPARLLVEIDGEPDFSSLEGEDFWLTGEFSPSCRIQHWYEDRLWGLPKTLHYSSDTLNTSSVFLFGSLTSARLTEDIARLPVAQQ